ncbi:hypothetical protein [Domibacillus epiphyticus]|nr:hypothetical protein [Domibacillus epiphyticus]
MKKQFCIGQIIESSSYNKIVLGAALHILLTGLKYRQFPTKQD